MGTSENKLCFDLLSSRVSAGAHLGGITSSEGLDSLGLPRMLLPQEPAAYLSGLGPGVRSPDSRSASGTTFYVVLGESLLAYFDTASFSLHVLPLTQILLLAGSLLAGKTLSGVVVGGLLVMNGWLWGVGVVLICSFCQFP